MIFFKKKQKDETEPVLAAAILNPVTSGIFADLLRTNGIPYLLRQKGAGGTLKIILGGGLMPDYFYVAPGDLEKARELYEIYLNTETEESEEED